MSKPGPNDALAERILREYARARRDEGIVFMTYGTLAARVGREGQHRLLGDPLDRVRGLCARLGVPDVAVMIVSKGALQDGTVEPSKAALEKHGGWPSLRKEQARVLAYDWESFLVRD